MRRIYRADGKSAPLWFLRSMLVPAAPALLCWAFCSRLVSEIGGAFWHARQDWRIEWAGIRRLWNGRLD